MDIEQWDEGRLVEVANVPEIYVDGLGQIQKAGSNYKLVFYTSVMTVGTDASLEHSVCLRLTLSKTALTHVMRKLDKLDQIAIDPLSLRGEARIM